MATHRDIFTSQPPVAGGQGFGVYTLEQIEERGEKSLAKVLKC